MKKPTNNIAQSTTSVDACSQRRHASSNTRGEDWNPSLMVADGVQVLGKFVIDSTFHDRVLNQFFDILPHVVKGGDYQAADLLGDQFWNGLSEHERRLASICLKGLFDPTQGAWNYRPDPAQGLIFSTC